MIIRYEAVSHLVLFLPTLIYSSLYTMFRKSGTLDIADNFCKCRLIFKISSLTDSQGNSFSNYDEDFHLTRTMLLHYLVKFKHSK